MRIIAGEHKGTKLSAPSGLKIRPTSDRVKEFIFSYLGDLVVGKRVLDLFAGSGGLGLEALSRGASDVTFVDQSARSVDVIKKNLQKIRRSERVCRMKAFRFILQASKENEKYDIIFCDPPYDYKASVKVLNLISDVDMLMEDGIVIFESNPRADFSGVLKYDVLKIKEMGHTQISVFGHGNK
jgi:16S rRNA (guanine(966)-N(2))-methyltransferase RsmD